MTNDGDDNLDAAISDWDNSSVLNIEEEAGNSDANSRSRCRAVKGKVRSCNYTYGNNGWLGLPRAGSGEVTSPGAPRKMNDTYLSTSSYGKTSRQHVICSHSNRIFLDVLGHVPL